jgi:hypothetical protein
MSRTKRHLEKVQEQFIKFTYRKDGAPQTVIDRQNWEDLVRDFYNGDANEAMDAACRWAQHNINDNDNYDLIPQSTMNDLNNYIDNKMFPGDFLRSVLEHDLFGAFAHADDNNMKSLPYLVKYIYNNCPANCHGHKGICKEWTKNG